MTAEVVIQLPGSYLYTSRNPATRIMSLYCHDCRSRNPATRIMGVKYNIMTAEVVIQLQCCLVSIRENKKMAAIGSAS